MKSKKFAPFFYIWTFLYPFFSYGTTYDCFIFFNELDLLDIRLHEMGPYIDKFVLVESVETFTGKEKPLYFEENKERFKDFQDKIIHVITEHHDAHPMGREMFQRKAILRGLKNAQPNDIIFISDVDEIVKRDKIPYIIAAIEQSSPNAFGLCQQKDFSYHLNTLSTQKWYGTVVFKYSLFSSGDLRTISPDIIREQRDLIDGMHFQDAGWHFSWMGGLKAALTKLESFAHDELDVSENKSTNFHLKGPLYKGNYHFSPWLFMEEIDPTFPSYILENIAYFIEKGYFLMNESDINFMIQEGRLIKPKKGLT